MAISPSPAASAPIDRARLTDLGDTVAVFAHPDDETYLCGGTMAALRDAGHRVVCVTATRGELGGEGGPEQLRTVRTRELGAALQVLGVDEHHWLDLPDGGLDRIAAAEPVNRLARLLEAIRPRTVLTFGPDGLTGHPDHIAIGRWTRAAVELAAVPGTRLLLAAVTAAHQARFAALEERLGVHVGEPAAATADEELAVRAALDGPLLHRKLRALAAQSSQTEPVRAVMGDDVFRDWVATEAFRPA